MTFFTVTSRTTSMDNSILINIVVCHQNRNSSQTFYDDNLSSKNFKKFSLRESVFNIREDYSLQPRIRLKSITDDFMRVFWNSCAENFGIVRKTYEVEFSLNKFARIQFTAYYRTAIKCLETKECSKISKNPKKSFRNCPFSFNATSLQSRISGFSKYKLQEKCFIWVFWNC